MILDYQILLKNTPLTLLVGSAPEPVESCETLKLIK